jgi:hypothetical protein
MFMDTGKVVKVPPIPENSKAKKGIKYSLSAKSLILHGHYKNDLETRLFMKKLVGEHFHFTAFGIDWIHERWMAEDPPTYSEFADFWSEEMQARKERKAQPKQEWAYLSFIQKQLSDNPDMSRDKIMTLWEAERKKKSQIAKKYILDFKKRSKSITNTYVS